MNDKELNSTEWCIKLTMAAAKMEEKAIGSINMMKQTAAMNKILLLMGVCSKEELDKEDEMVQIMEDELAAIRRMSEAVTHLAQIQILKENKWKELISDKDALLNRLKNEFGDEEFSDAQKLLDNFKEEHEE